MLHYAAPALLCSVLPWPALHSAALDCAALPLPCPSPALPCPSLPWPQMLSMFGFGICCIWAPLMVRFWERQSNSLCYQWEINPTVTAL